MMRIAFYKGSGAVFDKLIRWWTKSAYSHCEFVFSDGAFFSASPRDGGTRFKFIAQDEQWDFVDLPFSTMDELRIRNFCDSENGCNYDWIGIALTQVLPLSFESPWWWFCSEVLVAGLQEIGYFPLLTPSKIDPGQLYRLAKK